MYAGVDGLDLPRKARALFRRDWMILARQFIAWNTPKKANRPVGTV